MQSSAFLGRWRATRATALALAFATLTATVPAQETWTLVGNHPYGSNLEGMVYDSVRHETLAIYGGALEAWAWDGVTWSVRGSIVWSWYGENMGNYGVAFDSVRGVAVAFGGADLSGASNRTYEWDGSSWTEVFAATTTPPARTDPMMSDAGSGRVLMLGGTINGNPASDAWLWNGVDWQAVSAGPPARVGAALAYDGQNDRVVLVGGTDGFGSFFDQTWVFDATGWTQIMPAISPPATYNHAMAYDSTRGRMVLFSLGATWAFDGAVWAQLSPTATPDHRAGHGMAYDTVRDRVIMHSGYRPLAGVGSTDTWELTGPPVVTNSPPSAVTGADQVVDEGSVVSLDGSASSDPDGDLLTFAWTQLAGTAVTLSDATAAQPTFVAPWVTPGGETLSFQLVVDDGALPSDPAWVNVTIKNVNHVPVADAGMDQTVVEGALVTLDGSESYDEDGDPLGLTWMQTGGSAVTLSGTTDPMPTFTAPAVGASGALLTFDLMVSDGIDVSAADAVQVIVTNVNNAPTADAGPPQTVAENTLVALDGSGSSDPDGDPLGFSWSQLAGPSVSLSNPFAVAPTFTAPDVVGSVDLVFGLTVFDSNGAMSTVPGTTTVTIRDLNAPPDCQNARPSVATLWPPNHKMVGIEILGVIDPENQSVQITVTDVRQDEPTSGLGNGDSGPDAVLQGDRVLLRAERGGSGNGRVYRVSFIAQDGNGGQCTGTVLVTVPHDKKKAAVDGGPLYDATL